MRRGLIAPGFGADEILANVRLISYRWCRNSVGAAALATIWGCASHDILTYHTVLLSDAPSLFFVLLACMLMGS